MLVEEIILPLKSWAATFLAQKAKQQSHIIRGNLADWIPNASNTLLLLLFSFNRTNDRVCVMNDLPFDQGVDNISYETNLAVITMLGPLNYQHLPLTAH